MDISDAEMTLRKKGFKVNGLGKCICDGVLICEYGQAQTQ